MLIEQSSENESAFNIMLSSQILITCVQIVFFESEKVPVVKR